VNRVIGRSTNLRLVLPAVVSGLLSFAFCASIAFFLFREQSTSAAALEENLNSHRAAADLEENLGDLTVLLRARVEGVTALNDRIAEHLEVASGLADSPTERLLVDRVESSFSRYLQIWEQIPDHPGPEHESRIRAALKVIESETLKECEELREHNRVRMTVANEEHQITLRRLSWGLAAIGGSGGLAGLFLGYSVARGLSRSIQRLQVQVQDAAGKLGRDFPAVEFTSGNKLDQLDRQVQSLVSQIEEVVERLHQREREVRRAEQLAAVGQLAAGMAHEIRNPLTSIKMLVQTAREDSLSHLPMDDLAIIEREVRRVEQSLQTFLDFARPPKAEKAPIDLRAIIQETFNLTRGRAAKQRVEVSSKCIGERFTVSADAAQIRQVLVNLILNGLDAMPGGGALTLDLHEAGTQVKIVIQDTGPGIAPEMGDRLFEPFVSTRETGSGLGLVICKRIVEDHGGTIEAENAREGGARFTVLLPREPGRAR
jgi:two-component system, NtrC family, sensor histidine kinase HydH